MTVYSDIDRAVETALKAVEFDWTWTVDDVARLSEFMGWCIAHSSAYGRTLETSLAIQDPRAHVYLTGVAIPDLVIAGQDISWISVPVANGDDSGNCTKGAELSAAFDRTCDRLAAELGEPTHVIHDSFSKVRWDFEHIIVSVTFNPENVTLSFINPTYQAWADEPEE